MKNARRLWLSIHLYLGLSIGALLVLLGLTGSILVFYLDIDQIINPQTEPTTVPYEMPAQPGHHNQTPEINEIKEISPIMPIMILPGFSSSRL